MRKPNPDALPQRCAAALQPILRRIEKELRARATLKTQVDDLVELLAKREWRLAGRKEPWIDSRRRYRTRARGTLRLISKYWEEVFCDEDSK